MKAFIAPVYFQTNSISSEKLTGGLLLITKKKSWVAFSDAKIAMAEKLGGKDIKKLLDHTLALFENKIEKANIQAEDKGLFELNETLSEQYIQYLSKYSKGVIQFAPPKPIATEASTKTFEKLFQLYIGEALPHKEKKLKHTSFHTVVKEKLETPVLKEKADIDYVLTPQLIKGILQPAHITLITKNGAIEALQAIDFTNTAKTVVDHIYEFEVIVKHLQKFGAEKKLKKGHYNVVVNKAEKGTEQEEVFNNFYMSAKDSFNIIEHEEMDSVINGIIKNPHTKFSEFIEDLANQ
jgi:hypothetical protein